MQCGIQVAKGLCITKCKRIYINWYLIFIFIIFNCYEISTIHY